MKYTMEPGTILSKEIADMTEDFSPIPDELKNLILKTFCESHAKIEK